MKARFYLLDGASNASSYHRALQFFPFLRDHGIEPSASLPVPEALYQRLVEGGRSGARDKALFYGLFLARRLAHVLAAGQADVVVIQRDLFPFGPPALERLLRRANDRLVYDTDDATYLRPSFTSRSVFQRSRRFDKVAQVVREARWVSVATEPIAAWARAISPRSRVTVVPMAVDWPRYQSVRGRLDGVGAGGALTVGWTGTRGSLPYLEALAPVLRELATRHGFVVRVVSGAYQDVRLPGVPVAAAPWRAAGYLKDVAQFAIGLVPLADTPFEQAKFPFKLLQYQALGVPVVCARVGAAATLVEDGANGLLAGSLAEWRDKLTRLLLDPALRQRLAVAGCDTVRARYTIDRVGPLLVDGLRSAAVHRAS